MNRPFKLECGHTAEFDVNPLKGDMVWCYTCDDYHTVLYGVDEWSFQCIDCKYSRKVGVAPVTASTKANAHAITKHHRVKVYHENKLQFIAGGSKDQLAMF